MRSRIEVIIEFLLDSNKSLEDGCSYIHITKSDLTEKELNTLYSQIFRCNICGWWCDISERNEFATDDFVCDDCIYLEVHQD